MAKLPTDVNRQPIPVLRPLSSENKTMTGSSVSSTAFGANTTVVRLVCDAAVNYVLGASPTATAASTYLPGNVVEYISVFPGEKVAGIGASGALNITEMN